MATQQQAVGSLTIVDLNDAKALQGYISVDAGVSAQVYSSDSRNYISGNDWTSVNLKLVPHLIQPGTGTTIDLCTTEAVSVAWYENFYANPGTYTLIAATAGRYSFVNSDTSGRAGILVSANLLGNTTTKTGKFKGTITYVDSLTTLTTTMDVFIDVSVTVTQAGTTAVVITSDSGYAFKNGATNTTQTITLTSTLYKGSAEDTVNNTYKWYVNDVLKQTRVSGDANYNKFTITPDMVFGKAIVKAEVIDDNVSFTYYQTTEIMDLTDPLQVDLKCNIGNVFKVGISTVPTITATVSQSGMIITPANAGYLWMVQDKNGNDRPGWASTFTGSTGVAAVSTVVGGVTYYIDPLVGTPLSKNTSGNAAVGDTRIVVTDTTGIKNGQLLKYSTTITSAHDIRVNRVDTTNKIVYLDDVLPVAIASGQTVSLTLNANERITTQNSINIALDDIDVRGTVLCEVLF